MVHLKCDTEDIIHVNLPLSHILGLLSLTVFRNIHKSYVVLGLLIRKQTFKSPMSQGVTIVQI